MISDCNKFCNCECSTLNYFNYHEVLIYDNVYPKSVPRYYYYLPILGAKQSSENYYTTHIFKW